MYGYEWTDQNGIYRLSVNSKIEKEIRPVFKEELDYFGLNEHWSYPDTKAPLLWAEGIRRYILNGICVAEATGGGFYTKPNIIIHEENLTLEPIDIDALWKENERLMLGLEKTSMDKIRSVYKQYKEQGMAFAVAFSGGKDSVATAIKLKDDGRDVRLFYVSGINKAYPDEMTHAIQIAEQLDLPLHVAYVKQHGKTVFKESPVKNQIIASMALDYAINNNLGCSIAFGDFTSDNIHNSQFFE